MVTGDVVNADGWCARIVEIQGESATVMNVVTGERFAVRVSAIRPLEPLKRFNFVFAEFMAARESKVTDPDTGEITRVIRPAFFHPPHTKLNETGLHVGMDAEEYRALRLKRHAEKMAAKLEARAS